MARVGDAGCGPPAGAVADPTDVSRAAVLFSALADPVRLRILSAIVEGGEVCACHLEGPLARSQPTISHHTSRLAEVGLIEGERRGRWVHWRARPEALAELRGLLEHLAERA